MRIVPAPMQLTEKEGFTPEKDIFNLAPFGAKLTTLFERIDHPLVAVLDAPWGSGKTTFVGMWKGSLEADEFPVIYFDAFANDYMQDAFAALAGEVLTLAAEHAASGDEAYRDIRQKSIQVMKVLLRSSLKIGARAM